MEYIDVVNRLKSLHNPRNVEGMKIFAAGGKNTLGISIPILRKIAKEIGKDHDLALKLWNSDIHEARIIASMIDKSDLVTEKQMNNWVRDFDSWDICDQVCTNLFDRTKFVHKKIVEWVKDDREFIRRAGFVLIATSAVHNKNWKDNDFERYFPLIKRYSIDDRNFVKKAVNWALRQVGKRNKRLNKEAIKIAKKIQKIDSKSAGWIASDALRELTKKRF